MTAQVRAFLPAGAVTTPRVRQALDALLSGWSAACLSRARADVALHEAAQLSSLGEPLTVEGRRATLSLSGNGKRRLLEAALGETLEGKGLTEADHGVLDAFARKLLGLLMDRLDADLGTGDRHGADIRLDLSLDGKVAGVLTMDEQALVSRIKAGIGAGRNDAARPTSRTKAIAGVTIPVEGVLGTAGLTIEELDGLAPGDVLILDSKLTQSAGLRIAGQQAIVAHGRPAPDQNHNGIIIGS